MLLASTVRSSDAAPIHCSLVTPWSYTPGPSISVLLIWPYGWERPGTDAKDTCCSAHLCVTGRHLALHPSTAHKPGNEQHKLMWESPKQYLLPFLIPGSKENSSWFHTMKEPSDGCGGGCSFWKLYKLGCCFWKEREKEVSTIATWHLTQFVNERKI